MYINKIKKTKDFSIIYNKSRLFKEFVHLNKERFHKDTDYVFVGKSILKDNLKNIKYKDIEKDLSKVIK